MLQIKPSSVKDESFRRELQLNFATHMNIISFEILTLNDVFFYIGQNFDKRQIKIHNIRIGHGLAFAQY